MKYTEMPIGLPQYHLAIEQAVFEKTNDDVLMLWQNDPCVVCGSYQNVFEEVDVYAAYKKGVPVIRRQSGGGTVYHDGGNVNYTLITKYDETLGYGEVMADMIAALKKMGINAEKGGICDISVQGKKVSGNAQRVCDGKLLHHGTLLFDTDLSALKGFCSKRDKEYASKGIKSVNASVTNLKQYLGGGVSDFKKSIIVNYPKRLEPFEIDGDVLLRAEQLLKERYFNDEWTYLKNPNFSLKAERPCGKISYYSEKGIITEGEIVFEGKNLSKSLIGKKLIPSEIEKICFTLTDKAEQLASLIL